VVASLHSQLCNFVFDALRERGDTKRHTLKLLAWRYAEVDYSSEGGVRLRAALDELADEGSITFDRNTAAPLLEGRAKRPKPSGKVRRVTRRRPILHCIKTRGRIPRQELLAWARDNILVDKDWTGGPQLRAVLLVLRSRGEIEFNETHVWYVERAKACQKRRGAGGWWKNNSKETLSQISRRPSRNARKSERTRFNPSRTGANTSRFAKTHTGAFPVLGDENHAGSFKGFFHGEKRGL
jgi:hypothetical protein